MSALEAVKNLSLDDITEENYAAALNILAANVTDVNAPYVSEIISKFHPPPSLLTTLFDKSVLESHLSEQDIRKYLKSRQDSTYKISKHANTRENPVGFAELLSYCTESPDWAGIELIISKYNLDPLRALGVILDLASASGKYDNFVTIYESSPWTSSAHVLGLIRWRLYNVADWKPTLKLAVALIDRLWTFEDIYSSFGDDTSFMNDAVTDWEAEMAEAAGSSQFNALAMAGSLDDAPKSIGLANAIPPIKHRLYFVEFLLDFGFTENAYKIIYKFPLLAQMSTKIGSVVAAELFAKLEGEGSIEENTKLLGLLGPCIGCHAEPFQRLCTLILNLQSDTRFNQFRQWVLPAISLITDKSASESVWQILSTFTQEERYGLYTEWQMAVPRYYKPVKYALLKAEKEAKSVLKRISNENAETMLQKFSDVAEFNPYNAFSVFLSQVESYDKIGTLMLKNPQFSDMAWDLFPLVIMVQLSSGRSQQHGLLNSKWIQALSSFTARLAAKAPKFDCSKLILFVLKQFHQDNFDNLVMLKNLFLHMGGCVQLDELSLSQLEMLSSHKSIRDGVYSQLGAVPDPATVKRLLSALQDNEIVQEVFLALCYGYSKVVPKVSEQMESPKVLGHRLDEFMFVIQQYCHLLSKLDLQLFTLLIDDVPTLIKHYRVPVPLAMSLWRPFLAETIRKDDLDEDATTHPTIATLTEALGTISDKFDTSFFVAGWILETYDIFKFGKCYNGPARSSTISLASKTHAHVLDKTARRLDKEQSKWLVHPELNENSPSRRDQSLDILTKVVLPRALVSGIDALFASQFLFKLNTLGVIHFNFVSTINTFFDSDLIFNTLSSCSAYEAECFALFMDTLLNWLAVYLFSDLYHTFVGRKLIQGEESFTASLLVKRESNPGTRERNHRSLFSRTELHGCHDMWLRKLHNQIERALTSSEFVLVRNAITTIKVGKETFFRHTSPLTRIIDLVEKVAKEDERADIKLAATALLSQITPLLASLKKKSNSRYPSRGGDRREKRRGERSERDRGDRDRTERDHAERDRVDRDRSDRDRAERTDEPARDTRTDGSRDILKERESLREANRLPEKPDGQDSSRGYRRDRDRRDGRHGGGRRDRHWRDRDRRSHKLPPMPPPNSEPPKEGRDFKRSRYD